MLRVWRLCRRRYAARACDGEGARLDGGRWNTPGIAVVYASVTVSLAAPELLVHLDAEEAPADQVAIPVDVPAELAVREIAAGDLPRNWRTTPAPLVLQQLGNNWARALETPLLSVPSAVVPRERNYILNPRHPDASRLMIGTPEPFSFDPRLWK